MYSKISVKLISYLFAFLKRNYIIICDTTTTKTLRKIVRKQKNYRYLAHYHNIIYVKKPKGGGVIMLGESLCMWNRFYYVSSPFFNQRSRRRRWPRMLCDVESIDFHLISIIYNGTYIEYVRHVSVVFEKYTF